MSFMRASYPSAPRRPTPPPDAANYAPCPNARRGAMNHWTGLAAEDAAARLYAARGCAILDRRRRRPEGEIDLIVRDRDVIVFVEVKRRGGPIDRDPVSPRQWRRLEAAAQRYMVDAETGGAPCRFDVALVGADGAVEVIDNARC